LNTPVFIDLWTFKMRVDDASVTFSPTGLVRFWQNEFVSWLDRYEQLFPGVLPQDPVSEETELLFKKGLSHEAGVLEQLQQSPEAVYDLTGQNASATLAVLQEGHPWVFQASLTKAPFAGIADLLVRVDTPSLLGNHSYEVADVKLSRQASPTHILQLCCYAEMLEALQGIRPKKLHIILGDKEQYSFDTEDYYYYYLQVKQAFLAFHDSYQSNCPPDITRWDSEFDRWTSYVEELLETQDHLCRVANITKSQIKKLKAAGVTTLTMLASSEADRIPKLDQAIFQRLKAQASLQNQSKQEGKPVFELIPLSEDRLKQGIGLAGLPPASPLDVFFDMEGNPHYEGGLEYLFGATIVEDGQLVFKDWWAFNPQEEKQAFEAFIDWAYARWQADPTMHIYHYASYEKSAMCKLMGRYATREAEVDELLRQNVLVDLYQVVRQSLRIGEPSYSIKKLERFYRAARTTEIKGGGASIVYIEQWLDYPDGDNWETSKLLKEIRDYNEDDCVSTYQLTEWLREIQQTTGISYQSKAETTEPESGEGQSVLSEAGQLAEKILSAIPEDRSEASEQWRLHELLAWLLEFHRRDDKPSWHSFFDRLRLTDLEIADDYECLGALQRTSSDPLPEKSSLLFEYQYDPQQETKLKEGSNCALLAGGEHFKSVSIFSLDRNQGLVQLKVSPKTLNNWNMQALPDFISLIPYDFMDKNALKNSIFETVKTWKTSGALPPALEDFLYRRRPRLSGDTGGPIIPDGIESVDGAIQTVLRMQSTTLCIQGPPGTGKSYTAANMILALIQAGYRIGVTSNSHKAIVNLLEKVAELAKDVSLNCLKTGGIDERLTRFSMIRQTKDNSLRGITVSHYHLIGGTAWLFSKPDMQNELDYLFIDEAGQVSIANLVAMASSTRNFVLMGDQMQLEQPTQGTHPGESGQSILEYYLQDKATIPAELGIFLGITWRLHPEICRFISETVYEGRLKSKESQTAKQRIHLAAQAGKWVQQEAGVLFIPVEHEGNQQSCEEEVDVIREIMQELLGRTYEDGKGQQREISWDDILIVTPYNLQVRYLQDALGDQARVASVDKFQGQEAPVVIVSMCTSDGNDSLRGLDFLLSKNRMNVALSRAQALAIVVGSPSLGLTRPEKLAHIPLVNLFCRLNQHYCHENPQLSIKTISLIQE
jgi:predicted RecB family nuclease